MSQSTTPVPHDALFKTFLTHPETARDFLDIHLPPALRETCDLSPLQMESGSFIEEDLRAYFADVLYSVKTTKGDGYVYCLIEHQSSPDRHMAFRMAQWERSCKMRHLTSSTEEVMKWLSSDVFTQRLLCFCTDLGHTTFT